MSTEAHKHSAASFSRSTRRGRACSYSFLLAPRKRRLHRRGGSQRFLLYARSLARCAKEVLPCPWAIGALHLKPKTWRWGEWKYVLFADCSQEASVHYAFYPTPTARILCGSPFWSITRVMVQNGLPHILRFRSSYCNPLHK